MRAVQVEKWGESPKFTTSATQPEPSSSSEQVQIKVIASGLPQLVRSQAAGTHYSVHDVKPPYIPGCDGVGYTTDTNELVYFTSLSLGGGYAEYINVSRAEIVPVPPVPGASDAAQRQLAIKIAGLINPAMSSWMALHTRLAGPSLDELKQKQGGFTVLIIGATTMSGKIAASFARSLGASKIIGVARRQPELDQLVAKGVLDFAVLQKDPVTETDFASVLKQTNGVDVILDYIWGDVTIELIKALPSTPSKAELYRAQLIEIGAVSQQDLLLPGALMRSKNLSIHGAGPGSWSLRQLRQLLPSLIKGVVEHELDVGPVSERKIEDVAEAWEDKKSRTVFII